MAGALGTEPVLIVARAVAPPDPQVTPRPVDGAGIPNDHLGYAVTWFLLAVVWLGMTGLLAWRIWRRTA
jgi:surfeit locus 1 family protein